MKKKNIFFVLLICFINSSCNKEEQTDELQDKDFYSDDLSTGQTGVSFIKPDSEQMNNDTDS